MENTLVRTPILGTNQYKVKFGEKVKRKLKIKFATKVKIAFTIILIASVYANYALLKANYVITCSAGGHFVSKQTCGELAQAKFDSSELARQEAQNAILINNPDLR